MAEPWMDRQVVRSAQSQPRLQGVDRGRQRLPVRLPAVSQSSSLCPVRQPNMQNQLEPPTLNLRVQLETSEREQQAGNANMIADANRRVQQAPEPEWTSDGATQPVSLLISENIATSKPQRNFIMNKELTSRAKEAAITKNEAKDATQNNIICDTETLQLLLASGIQL